MMRHLKQFAATVLCFAMIAAMMPAPIAGIVKAAEGDGLLAEYKFVDSDVTDKSIADASGHGYDAVLEGQGAAISNGVLTLPGGAAGSTAAYVSLPGRLFENRDTLTITTWLKNETGKDNYSAMYFGTTTTHIGGGTANMPLHYWLLNPMQPDGYFKTTWTNGDNASTPYSTETPVSDTATSADWGLYTTVITPDRIIGYYNGVEVCNNSKSKTTTDFGTGLVAYIGRSAYNDKFYKGGVYGVRVYGKALTQAEVWKEYYDNMPSALNRDTIINTALAEVKDALVLDTTVTRDLSLPTEGAKGASITWESSNPNVISNDGKMTVPTETAASATLTATISIGGKSDTKYFEMTVPAIREQFDSWVKDFSLGTFYVSSDMELPSSLGANTSISWSSSNTNAIEIVTSGGKITGKVKRSANNSADVPLTLKANITYKNGSDNLSAQKNFDVLVRGEEDYAYLMAYTNSNESASLGSSLHLGYSVDGQTYTALNSNTGICFANNQGGQKNSNPNGLLDVYIFRKADGTYGMVARNVSTQKYIYVFDSQDLINFTNERKLTLDYDVSGDLQVVPVSEQGVVSYEIFFRSGSKKYKAVTQDFATVTDVVETDYTKETVSNDCELPEGASVGNIMSIGHSEYQRVVGKLDVVRNTGIHAPQIELKPGEKSNAASLLPQKVTADYSDGSTADMKVEWNQQEIAKADLSKAGTYEVTGTIQQTKYPNPFIEQRADPCILKGNDGYYYFTASYPVCGQAEENKGIGYDRVILRRAKTIEGLQEAEEIAIWECKNYADEYRYIWAPEIRLVDDQYYVFYTSSIDSSVWSIRPHVLKCTNPDDIMNPESWQAMGLMRANSGDTKAFTGFSLDMTVFEHQGHWYVIWPQTDPYSSLFIAEIDKDEPWRCISDSVKISIPEFSWERQVENVNEGPSVIKNNGRIYVAFSAAGTGPEYCVGLLSIDENADLLDAASWKKQGYPVLTSTDVPGEYGPGHNSFTVDEDGNAIFVYHARGQQCYENKCQWASSGSLYDPCRDARLKRVHWAADGTPILKMSYEEELAEENKTIKAVIRVSVPADGISLNKTRLNLTVGKTEKLTATIAPSNATDKTVTWKSDNTKVATVSGGTVTANAVGTTTITAATANGKTAKCTVSVTAAAVNAGKITLNKSKLTLGGGEKFTLKATVTPKEAAKKTVSWTTSNKKAATVSKGVVKTKSVKKATKVTITAKVDSKTAKCTVTVKPAPKKITLNAKKKTLKKGKTFQIKAKLPSGTASNTIKYKSSSKKVATVSASGKVKAVKKGKATITVTTFNNKKATIKITVK